MKFKRRFYRKFKYNRKRSFMFIFLFLLCLGFGLGYSLISTDLNIFGTTVLKDNRWSVYFDNIQEIEGSVSPTVEPEITDNTTVSFSAKLKKPGDKFEFLIDVVNDGTIDAKIGNISMSPILTEEQQQFFSYEVTYESGVALDSNQALDAGSSETLKLSFKYLEQEDNSLYPDTDQTFNVVLTGEYVQGTGNPINHPYLYNVLMNEAESGGLARKYTGEHHDSFTEEPSKDIYHWYATTDEEGTAVQNKNNVIFANHCWQMIRTTDTGGVKMIYNGEVDNGQCLNTRGSHVGYSQYMSSEYSIVSLNNSYYYGTDYIYDKSNNSFILSGTVTTGEVNINTYTCRKTTPEGTCSRVELVAKILDGGYYYVIAIDGNQLYSDIGKAKYNMNNTSVADVGYMYNKRYLYNNNKLNIEIMYNDSFVLSTSYWYGDSVSWNSSSNMWILNNPYKITSTSDYSNLLGKYTFESTSSTSSYKNVDYIAYIDNSTAYYFELTDGHDYSYYNDSYTFGDTYTDNGDGTYTINNPTTFQKKDFFSVYNDIEYKYVCKNAVNNTCNDVAYNSLWVNGYTYSKRAISLNNISDTHKYGDSFIYENGEYVISGSTVSFFEYTANNRDKIKTHRYTCFNKSGVCSTLHYAYNYDSISIRNIPLTQGLGINDAINEMLYNDDVNSVDSSAKIAIDSWYRKNLSMYGKYLEETIFCNDRSVDNNIVTDMDWGSRINYKLRTDLSCPNITDRFSIENVKAKLTYSIGLSSYAEMNLLNNQFFLSTDNYCWVGTPYPSGFSESNVTNIRPSGVMDLGQSVTGSYALRPVVSLRKKIVYSSGDGSMESPYVIN